MVKFADRPVVEVTTDIVASPDRVWALVTDINTEAQFQDEFLGAEWVNGGPFSGAEFVGKNAQGERTWEVSSWVTAFEEQRVFGWSTQDVENPGATWTYTLTPIESGTRLSFHRVLGPGPSGMTSIIAKFPEREEEFIEARNAVHHANMTAVLEGIRSLAEDR